MKRKKVFVLFYDDMYDLFDTKIPSDFGFEKIFELPQGALLSMTHDHHQLFGPNYFARINLQSRHSLLTTHTLTTILHEHNIEVLHQSMLSIFSGKRKKPPLPPEEVLAVGFSSTMPKSIAWLNRCISNTKKLFPDAPVIVGGPSIILNPGWHEKVGADFFVVGDAEETLPRLLDSLARQLDIQSLPNLYWRDRHGEITCNPLHFKNCLQAAPITRWDLFDARSWPPAIHFESIRGCVYNCKFCSVSQLSKRIQLKSAERIAEEFAFYAARQVEFVLVFDSSMFTPLKRMKTFLTLMEKRHLPLRWGGMGPHHAGAIP